MARLRPAIVLGVVVVLAALLPAVPALLAPGLPGLQDATGLNGKGLVAREAVPTRVVRLDAGGRPRAYLLAEARRAERGSDPGLLLVLPAANRTVAQTYEQLGLDAWRDHGLAVAVASPLDNWNAGTCCGDAASRGVDDVAALAAITTDAVRRSGADRRRVAVLGYSTGALMVYRLLCEGALSLRAAVEVAGTLATSCDERRDLPAVLALHGQEDATVPLAGSAAVVPILGVAPMSVRAAVGQLSAAGGCVAGGADCPVRLVEVPGAGHRWEDLQPLPTIATFLADNVPGVR